MTVANPLFPGADPWVIRHDDSYLLCQSGPGNTLTVRRATTLPGLRDATPVTVWHAPPTGPFSRELWAPELHTVDGHWYIYVAADDGDNAHHRMIILEAAHPEGPFTLVGPLALKPDRWAIDGTLVRIGEALYFVWSGWEGSENVAQNLYICPLRDPVTPSGPRVCLSTPEHDWERRGSGGPHRLPTINEGPQALQCAGITHIIYSAAGSWCDDYCLGRLTLPAGGDPLDPAHWHKHPEPVFQKTASVFGPGHCSFTTDATGRDWIVYHTARHSGSGWDRVIRAQPFTWDGTTPVFGAPQSEGGAQSKN